MNRVALTVPYAFAKANGVVVTALGDHYAEVAVRRGAHSGALAELRRALGIPLRARHIDVGEFDDGLTLAALALCGLSL